MGLARGQILFRAVWNLWNVLEKTMQQQVKDKIRKMLKHCKSQEYFMLKTVLDEKINPYYAFDIFASWIVSRVDGDTWEKMAGKLLHAAWQKQQEEL